MITKHRVLELFLCVAQTSHELFDEAMRDLLIARQKHAERLAIEREHLHVHQGHCRRTPLNARQKCVLAKELTRFEYGQTSLRTTDRLDQPHSTFLKKKAMLGRLSFPVDEFPRGVGTSEPFEEPLSIRLPKLGIHLN
jgi:hypothetical protein